MTSSRTRSCVDDSAGPQSIAGTAWLRCVLVLPWAALAFGAGAAEVEPPTGCLDGVPTPAARVVGGVVQDLIAYLGVSCDDIELVEIEEATWPDTCLGLPAPALCAPGPTPGYRVVLGALGQLYHYHTDRRDLFRYAGPGDVPARPATDSPG